MDMEIIKIDLDNIDLNVILKAGNFIKDEKIVVFPSDTSYGIAGDTANNQVLMQMYLLNSGIYFRKTSLDHLLLFLKIEM